MTKLLDNNMIDLRRRGRPTWLEVDLDRLVGNVRATRKFIGARTRLMAVVKANAYGHGAPIIAETALSSGADTLAVATVDEGAALRTFGIRAPILVLGPISTGEIALALDHSLSLTATAVSFVTEVAREAERRKGQVVDIHVKLDTGMNRFGGTSDAILDASRLVAICPSLNMAGLYTHFAEADGTSTDFTDRQLSSLQEAAATLKAEGIQPDLVHASNSAAILRSDRYHLDMVRLGISLYGLPPATGQVLPSGFRPVLSVKSTVTRTIDLAPGDTVSYGRTYTATGHEQAALVPIGYADGLRRDLSNREVMAIQGVRVPIRGRVCMDQTVVGVPQGQSVSVGDIIDVVGTGESGELSFDQAADMLGTLSYELVAALSMRSPRYYFKQGRLVAVTDLRGTRKL